MHIKLSELRKIIKEVALSPSIKGNNKVLNDPMQNKNIAKAVNEASEAFKRSLEMNLTLMNWDANYNAQTRQFNDEVFEKIQDVTQTASETVASRLTQAVRSSWEEAHKSVGGEKKKVA